VAAAVRFGTTAANTPETDGRPLHTQGGNISINIRTKFHPIGNATEMPVASQNCSLSVDNAVNVSGADPGGAAPDIWREMGTCPVSDESY